MTVEAAAFIAAGVWVSLLIVVIALCRAARRGDANSERLNAAVR